MQEKQTFRDLSRVQAPDIDSYIQKSEDTVHVESYLQKHHDLQYAYAQVRYLFHPDALRSESLDFDSLAKLISQKYDLHFEVPDVIKIMQQRGSNPIDVNDQLKAAVDSSKGLIFLDGILRYKDRGEDIERFIESVNIHSQNIRARVRGTSGEAEFIVRSIACDILETQKMGPRWEAFSRYIQHVTYQTTTRQRLGFGFNALLSPTFKSFVSGTIESDLGWKMAMLPVGRGAQTKDDYQVVCTFHSLECKVAVFDKTSGDQDDADFHIAITNRRDYGGDYFSITSNLSSSDHIIAVRSLIKAITGK